MIGDRETAERMHTRSGASDPPTRYQGRWTGLKLFVLLMFAAALAALAIMPYVIAISPAPMPDLPIWQIVLFNVLPNLVLIAPLTALGLWLGPKVGLGAPLLVGWIDGQPDARARIARRLPVSIGIGAGVGVVLILVGLAFLPWLPSELNDIPVPSWWQGLLASFSAGVTEELMMRLGLMTLFVWLGARLLGQSQPTPIIVWTANGIAALLFGALHLPLAASLAPLTAIMVIRTLLLNGIAGVVFGWQYWRHGLVAAMAAHLGADIVLHVLSPLLLVSP
jgi:membrane protease YdiL (CAAX protease family)